METNDPLEDKEPTTLEQQTQMARTLIHMLYEANNPLVRFPIGKRQIPDQRGVNVTRKNKKLAKTKRKMAKESRRRNRK